MFIVFELVENENPSDILNPVVRTPKGIFETEELAREWIFTHFEMYTHVFQDGREYIKHNADKTVIHIKYEGGCQPDPNFEATYVIRPYELNTVFDEVNYFNNEFFENISNELSEIKF